MRNFILQILQVYLTQDPELAKNTVMGSPQAKGLYTATGTALDLYHINVVAETLGRAETFGM